MSSLVALVGAFVAVVKYLDEKAKANRTAQIESQKPFSQKQQEVYFDIVSTTALISTEDRNDPKWQAAVDHFWVLFWGAIPMVANAGVAQAMDAFSEALDVAAGDAVRLRNASMDLARACRRELGDAWNLELQTLKKPRAAG